MISERSWRRSVCPCLKHLVYLSLPLAHVYYDKNTLLLEIKNVYPSLVSIVSVSFRSPNHEWYPVKPESRMSIYITQLLAVAEDQHYRGLVWLCSQVIGFVAMSARKRTTRADISMSTYDSTMEVRFCRVLLLVIDIVLSLLSNSPFFKFGAVICKSGSHGTNIAIAQLDIFYCLSLYWFEPRLWTMS